MKIGEKTLQKGGEMLTNIMLSYISKINEAFLNNNEDDLKIGLSLNIKPGPANGNFKLKADINFVTQKITDTFTDSVDELQVSLFEKDEPTKVCPLRENGDEVFQTVCNKCPDRLELIFVSGTKMPVIIPPTEEPPAVKEGEMVQFRSCAAWADEDTHTNIREMLRWEPAPKQNTYRIRNKKTNKWWEGETVSAAAALKLAGWKPENCEIKIQSDNGSGGWKKCHELEEKEAA